MNKIFLIFFMILFLSKAYGLNYDYASTKRIPIRLSITDEINTKMPIYEGQKLKFKVQKSVFYNNNKILKQGDIVEGKIETIITNGMNGFPAEIILDNFDIPNINQSQLISTYTKTGLNRCTWVIPLKILLTPLFPSGSLTNFIKGGEAKITPDDTITIYYYPEWL